MNLVINARDAMPNGGRLTLRTENAVPDGAGAQVLGVPLEHAVRLTVSDTGTGMAAETQAHIFEPFFTTKEVGKGTGLGLATVYGIVQQAGGHISVESETGKGTTFRIHFPRAAEPCPPSTISPALPDTEDRIWGSEIILLVEDQEGLRKLLVEILQRHGYTVLHARDGREALRLAEAYENKIDLILTDLVMPEMGGRELVEALTASRPETRVLYMSGYTDKSGEAGKLTSGRHGFIDKPFPPEALLRRVRKILDGSVRAG
jgi:two-component system cell cycle sensor histidine kinase/response regulator CckA